MGVTQQCPFCTGEVVEMQCAQCGATGVEHALGDATWYEWNTKPLEVHMTKNIGYVAIDKDTGRMLDGEWKLSKVPKPTNSLMAMHDAQYDADNAGPPPESVYLSAESIGKLILPGCENGEYSGDPDVDVSMPLLEKLQEQFVGRSADTVTLDLFVHPPVQKALYEVNAELLAALKLAMWAMQQPQNEWKSECERKALDAANKAMTNAEKVSHGLENFAGCTVETGVYKGHGLGGEHE
jgi:hypothetical protein